MPPRTSPSKPSSKGKAAAKPPNYDYTSTKRSAAHRERKERVEALLEPAEFAEVEAMLKAGISGGKKSALLRDALHEKYLRFMEEKA